MQPNDKPNCHTKDHCDTEFEASVKAAKTSAKYNIDFSPYKCPYGDHYHITHTDPLQRRGYGKKYWRCPKCKDLVKTKNAPRHRC